MRVATAPGTTADTLIGAPIDGEVVREALGRGERRELRDRVRPREGVRAEPGHRHRVDDVRRRPGREHARHERADAVEDAPEVDAERPRRSPTPGAPT